MKSVFAAILMTSALVVGSAAQAQDRDIETQFLRLTGSDGKVISAFLMHPADGFNPAAPGVVLHHGGPGGHGARLIGAARSAAERLAEAGYTTITLVSRHSDDYIMRPLEEAGLDIDACADYLESLGVTDLILLGHSMGSVRGSIYLAQSKDPRFKAFIHFAPTADLNERFQLQDQYDDAIKAAKAAVAEGQGGFPEDDASDEGLKTPPIFATGFGRPQTAEILLNWWGPEANTSNSELFKEIEIPMLLLSGTADPYVPQGRMQFLKEQAGKSPRVDYIWYEDIDHYFTGAYDDAVPDVIDWLADIGLEPGAPIRTRLFDNVQYLTIDAGMPNERPFEMNYPGVLFEPANGRSRKSTAVLVIHDWQGNIMTPDVDRYAKALAASGTAAIVPQLRTSGFRGSLDSSFELTQEDLDAWLKAARNAGYRRVVGMGLGRAAPLVSAYQKSADDKAFDGLILVDPPLSLRDYVAENLGEEQLATLVQEAGQLIDDDMARSRPLVAAFRPKNSAAPKSIERIIQYPESFLDYYGPDAKTVLSRYLPEIDVPIMIVAGPNRFHKDGAAFEEAVRKANEDVALDWRDAGSASPKEAAQLFTDWWDERF